MPMMQQYMKRLIERNSGFVTIMTPEHRNYEEGGAFIMSHIQASLAAGAIYYLHVKTGNSNKTTAVKGLNLGTNRLMKVELFAEPTINVQGTTEALVTQRDRNKTSLYVCPTKVYTDTTFTSMGTLLRQDVYGTGGSGYVGAIEDEEGFNFKKNTSYVYRITNVDGQTATYIDAHLRIYMVTDREPVF